MEARVLWGIALFRCGAWVWMAAVQAVNADKLERPWLAWLLIGAALVVTVVDARLAWRREPLPTRMVIIEYAVALALTIGSGVAMAEHSQFAPGWVPLGEPWSMSSVLTIAVLFGPFIGIATGLSLGAGRVIAALLNGGDTIDTDTIVSYGHWTVWLVLAAGLAGAMAIFLRRAESQISASRAREEVARTLHDGVLQTLAIIERRTDDANLKRLAHEQERDLRAYLFGAGPTAERGGAAELGPVLRTVAARFEDAFDARAEVVLAPDLPDIGRSEVLAVAGAVGEALVNAGKHGQSRRVVVYAEPGDQDGLACSIKDDGVGFDTALIAPGRGIRDSICERLAEVGGRAEVESRPGSGTEVRLWIP